MKNLPLEVRQVDNIEIDQPQSADASRGEIECDRRSETPGSDEEDSRLLERALAFFSNLRQENVAAVANELFASQLRRFASGSAIHTHDIFRTESVCPTTGR